MASGRVLLELLVSLAAALVVCLQQCSGVPVDPRQQVVQLLEKGNHEDLAKYDLCLVCEVRSSARDLFF